MNTGKQHLRQGKYSQAELAFSEAAAKAQDGESLYKSLKALADVYEERGDIDRAESVRRQAVVVMGHCLEDHMNGKWPCPVREAKN